LLHLVDDVRRFSLLVSFGLFPFEIFLQRLKKLIRKSDKPLAQLVKRIGEMAFVNSIDQ
jgi:hypothetical protein